MKHARILALAATALLAACDGLISAPQPASAVYEADRQAYDSQESIATILTNVSQADVGYNLCLATLEARVDGRWTRVARTPEHPCALVLFTLAAGETAEGREPASAVPGPGTCRLRTSIEARASGDRRHVVTDPFTVQ